MTNDVHELVEIFSCLGFSIQVMGGGCNEPRVIGFHLIGVCGDGRSYRSV